MYGLLERNMVVSEISLFRTFRTGRSEPDLCNRLCVQRQDPVRIDVHPPVQLDVRPILDGAGAGAGQLGSQLVWTSLEQPKRIPVDSSQEKYGVHFSGGTPSYPCFFMEMLGDFPSKKSIQRGIPISPRGAS